MSERRTVGRRFDVLSHFESGRILGSIEVTFQIASTGPLITPKTGTQKRLLVLARNMRSFRTSSLFNYICYPALRKSRKKHRQLVNPIRFISKSFSTHCSHFMKVEATDTHIVKFSATTCATASFFCPLIQSVARSSTMHHSQTHVYCLHVCACSTRVRVCTYLVSSNIASSLRRPVIRYRPMDR